MAELTPREREHAESFIRQRKTMWEVWAREGTMKPGNMGAAWSDIEDWVRSGRVDDAAYERILRAALAADPLPVPSAPIEKTTPWWIYAGAAAVALIFIVMVLR